MFKINIIALLLLLTPLAATNSHADLLYVTSTFQNAVVIVNNATTYSMESDVFEGGVQVGTLVSTFTYGGGTNPFNTPSWSAGGNFNARLDSTNDANTAETANGLLEFSLTVNAGWKIDGLSLFTSGTTLGNPTFANITSSTGTGLVFDDNQGLSNELIANFDDGDVVTNGSDIVLNPGTVASGIRRDDHSSLWSYDSAGANYLSFDYQAGPVTNISAEGIRFDASFSEAIPEPSSLSILGLLAFTGCMRRRRR